MFILTHYIHHLKKTWRYLIFDLMVINGSTITQRSFNTRLGMLQQDVIQPFHSNLRNVTDATKLPPFTVELKKMERSYGLHLVFEQIPKLKHKSDGIIWTPVKYPYTSGACEKLLKWKPPELNTVDFRIAARWSKEHKPIYSVEVLSHGVTYKFYDHFQPEPALATEWKSHLPDGRIAEFRYDSEWEVTIVEQGYAPIVRKGGWRFVRFRDDKGIANDEDAVRRTLNSIRDGVTKEQLLAGMEKVRAAWKAREKGLPMPSLSSSKPSSDSTQSSHTSPSLPPTPTLSKSSHSLGRPGSKPGSISEESENPVTGIKRKASVASVSSIKKEDAENTIEVIEEESKQKKIKPAIKSEMVVDAIPQQEDLGKDKAVDSENSILIKPVKNAAYNTSKTTTEEKDIKPTLFKTDDVKESLSKTEDATITSPKAEDTKVALSKTEDQKIGLPKTEGDKIALPKIEDTKMTDVALPVSSSGKTESNASLLAESSSGNRSPEIFYSQSKHAIGTVPEQKHQISLSQTKKPIVAPEQLTFSPTKPIQPVSIQPSMPQVKQHTFAPIISQSPPLRQKQKATHSPKKRRLDSSIPENLTGNTPVKLASVRQKNILSAETDVNPEPETKRQLLSFESEKAPKSTSTSVLKATNKKSSAPSILTNSETQRLPHAVGHTQQFGGRIKYIPEPLQNIPSKPMPSSSIHKLLTTSVEPIVGSNDRASHRNTSSIDKKYGFSPISHPKKAYKEKEAQLQRNRSLQAQPPYQIQHTQTQMPYQQQQQPSQQQQQHIQYLQKHIPKTSQPPVQFINFHAERREQQGSAQSKDQFLIFQSEGQGQPPIAQSRSRSYSSIWKTNSVQYEQQPTYYPYQAPQQITRQDEHPQQFGYEQQVAHQRSPEKPKDSSVKSKLDFILN
ncbi:unnamed protein product [Rhizopus stolonifer]